ncbi:hypothetical protein TNCV_4421281 [Trichonephila clavipes]|nr:hypothetical protein TNCV_4421281 [Trichonephila clavipes]
MAAWVRKTCVILQAKSPKERKPSIFLSENRMGNIWKKEIDLEYEFYLASLAVGSTLVYCYRCTNASFVDSSMSAAPWIACKDVFIPDPPHGKPSTSASTMGSGAQSLAS